MDTPIHIGSTGEIQYEIDSAKRVLAGYAFATVPMSFQATGRAYGHEPEISDRPRWAYRTYDCIAADPGHTLTVSDILVAEGINAVLDVAAIGALLGVAPAVSEALSELDEDQTFWELSADDIEPRGIPTEGSPSWNVHRAWWLLVGTPEIGTATAHKVLHHKRPQLFPLLDNKTLPLLGGERAWVQIHEDLTAQRLAFDELESWLAEQAEARGGAFVPLSRLRIQDILTWCWAVGQRQDGGRLGTQLLDR